MSPEHKVAVNPVASKTTTGSRAIAYNQPVTMVYSDGSASRGRARKKRTLAGLSGDMSWVRYAIACEVRTEGRTGALWGPSRRAA